MSLATIPLAAALLAGSLSLSVATLGPPEDSIADVKAHGQAAMHYRTASPTPAPVTGVHHSRPTLPADSGWGTTRFHLRDSRVHPGATCSYDHGDPRRRVFVPVHLPAMLWPDLAPKNPDESGTVGWRLTLQTADGPDGPFHSVYTSILSRGIATETVPADIPKLAINWRIPDHVWWRIGVHMVWIDGAGAKIGVANHTIDFYRLAIANRPWSPVSFGGKDIGATLGVSKGACANYIPKV